MSATRELLTPYFRRQWRALVVAALSTVVVAVAEVLRPFPLKFVIDHLFAGGGAPEAFDVGRDELWLLAGVAALVVGIALLDAAAAYVMDVRLLRAGERIVHDLRVAVYSHLQRLSLGFHQRRHTGDLVTRVTSDVNAVGTLFSTSLATLVSAVLTLIGMIVVSLLLDPLLALVAFATAPLLAAIAFRYKRRVRALARQQRRMEGEMASLAEEALSSIQQVKALGSESFEHERLEQKSEQRRETGLEASVVEGRFARLVDIVGAIGTAAVLVVGVFRVEAGAITPGELVVMAAYARRVYRPLRLIAREWVRLSRAMARAERVAEVLSADELLHDRGGPRPERTARGGIAFESVAFAYDPDRPALTDVSLEVPAGQRLAVVGRSGAGKSTLAALVARFYDPDSGRVLIDGVDARDHPLPWLRDQIGLVLQDPVLFSGTVAENIAWGIDATRVEVERAARAVGADAFIRELPHGYDTKLDPAGAGLSGGQRQRIAIARTLLRDPAILLLDEPTAGLDAESEADLLAGLDVLMRGRTTVMITHALALARRADRAVVLEDGRVVQEGEPDALLAAEGAFRRLAEEQGLAERRPPRRRRASAIADADLPQAGTLLDPDAAAEVLARSLGNGGVEDVDVQYLRYKPSTNLVVHYDVRSNGHRHDAVAMIRSRPSSLAARAAEPQNIALARLVASRAPAALPLAYDDEVGCLVQWYPLDLSLPVLALPPAELRELLASAGVQAVDRAGREPERLAYKPRRRAVLRVDGHVVRTYARQRDYESALAGQQAASTLTALGAPRLEAALPDRFVTVQSFVAGDRVSSAEQAAGEAGALLAELHSTSVDGLRRFGADGQLAAATASARLVTRIAPDLRRRVAGLLGSLAAAKPEDVALVPSHGDFNARQLLVTEAGLTVIDFDEFCLAAPALDPAVYAADVMDRSGRGLGAAWAVLDDLLAGYGARPVDLSWYLATTILREAPRPFRYFEPDWRERVEDAVAAAEEALES